jgi:intracellular septation protein A
MTTPSKPNPLIEIAVTVIAPAVVLMKLSGEQQLGSLNALLLALAFPLAWGQRDAVLRRKLSWLAVLGVVSTLLTGGIGLLQLDASWLAVKEAAVPALIGMAVLGSMATRRPLIHVLVFNPDLFDVPRVQRALAERQSAPAFEARLRAATLMLAGTFFFSATANYLLARWIVTSPAGSTAFNEELGRLTLLSYPFIAIPSMLMMGLLMYWLAREARSLTGLPISQFLRTES